jgi:hypothetical protein
MSDNKNSSASNSDITVEVIQVLLRIPQMDEGYLRVVVNEIQKNQPFVFTYFMKLSLKYTDGQADEFLKLLMIVWDYYKSYTTSFVVEIKERDFSDYLTRNTEMLSYLSKKDQSHFSIEDAMKFGLTNDHSKSLMSIILLTAFAPMHLGSLELDQKKIMLNNFKTLIQCFDRNLEG